MTCSDFLLGQAVQNVGNMDTSISRTKEAWMAPLQATIQRGVAQMKQFILQLIDTEEKEGKCLIKSNKLRNVLVTTSGRALSLSHQPDGGLLVSEI